jgi:transcription factor IIIB subunit 2
MMIRPSRNAALKSSHSNTNTNRNNNQRQPGTTTTTTLKKSRTDVSTTTIVNEPNDDYDDDEVVEENEDDPLPPMTKTRVSFADDNDNHNDMKVMNNETSLLPISQSPIEHSVLVATENINDDDDNVDNYDYDHYHRPLVDETDVSIGMEMVTAVDGGSDSAAAAAVVTQLLSPPPFTDEENMNSTATGTNNMFPPPSTTDTATTTTIIATTTTTTKKKKRPLRRPPVSTNVKRNITTTNDGHNPAQKRLRTTTNTTIQKNKKKDRNDTEGDGFRGEEEEEDEMKEDPNMISTVMKTTTAMTNNEMGIDESVVPEGITITDVTAAIYPTKGGTSLPPRSNLHGSSRKSIPPPVPDTDVVVDTVTNNNNNQNSATATTIMTCPNCGSSAIENHEASGATICTECGVVVEENAIVSSIEFVEGAGGSSNMVGQYVSATSSKAYTSTGGGGGGNGRHSVRGGGRYGFSRDSRETTLANGRRRIQELASRLRLSSHYVDGAHRLFTVAVERNFVQGRRTSHVVAACLYMACRQEKSQHMLIDFSDALQVNVYTLGTCFLKFRRLLGLKLEIIDPALYVYRFAAHLDLDDRANAVSLTSLRLVARMKRDWIVAGRRPAGICAAALLIAARAHGFDKHCADVTRILRVCGMTVTNRIREFERTPSAHLSLEQFQTIDFEAEADPPIYTKNKIREARAKAIQEGNVQLLTSGVLDDDGKGGSRWRNATKKQRQPSERSVKFQELYQNLDKKLNDEDDEHNVVEERMAITNVDPTTMNSDQLVVHDGNTKLGTDGGTTKALVVQWREVYPKNRGRNMILPHEATVEEQLPAVVPTEAKLNLSDWKQSLPNEIDLEIEDIFRTSKEEKEKEAIFNKINKDYIAQQERKENERLDMEAATKDQEVDDLAQAAGQARYKDVMVGRNSSTTGTYNKSKRNRENHHSGENNHTVPTTEEQLRAAVASRRVSRKINYDALSSIFDDDDGSLASTKIDKNEPDDYGNNRYEDDYDDENDYESRNHDDIHEEVMI